MAKEILIKTDAGETQIAITENGRLAEFYIENTSSKRTLGNIYLGCINSVRRNLEAAFIDIGEGQIGFLHRTSLSANLEQQLAFVKAGGPSVEEFLARRETASDDGTRAVANGQGRHRKPRGWEKFDHLQFKRRLLVTVTKEPLGSKGPRLSTDVTLAGRFLVLVPLSNQIAVSRRIRSYKEQRRLRTVLKNLCPQGFGVIVRTAAQYKDAKAIHTDLKLLLERWRKIEAKLAQSPRKPGKLYEDMSLASSLIRDLFSDDFHRILVDQPKLHRFTKLYVQAVAPHMAESVQLHTGSESVFEKAGVGDQVAELFSQRVDLPSGGHLVFEKTEAMHVIDVNSGSSGRKLGAEQSGLQVNLEAAEQIARHMILRNLGGLIVIDFIDLRLEENRKKLHDRLSQLLKKDRATTDLLPMSEFGIVQIARERKRPSVKASQQEEEDDGFTSPSPDSVEAGLRSWLDLHEGGKLRLQVHPFTAAWLTNGIFSVHRRLQLGYKRRIHIDEDDTLGAEEFRFLDAGTGLDITETNGQFQQSDEDGSAQSNQVAAVDSRA